MQRWGHNFRFLAVSALVVLALTGFSTGSHGSTGGSGKTGKTGKSKSSTSRGSKSRSGGGGGCSSSSQDHDTSHDDTYDDTYGDDAAGAPADATATATGMPQQDAIVTLVSCASKKRPYATVQLHNPNDQDGTFDLTISFLDAKGRLLDAETDDVDVPANETVTVKEYVGGKAATKVTRCKVPDLARPANS
ncbi:hypothetical protein [Streptomyces griseosporeus]|uniref:hypothetical protein n=1 Tax=Streptomyces griseosporeus TaxID=1910 RepID=UPI00167E9F3A|nr:hypothetical protein [Streptomyces griseosporeus]GHF79023.1 hypothetical protein GCM10018783_56680 [Streptomyces griseosporeus]